MMKNRFIPLLLSALLIVPNAAYADDRSTQELTEIYTSDFIDMDRVYKYDFLEKAEKEEKPKEAITHKNAVTAVTALGLMFRDGEGNFNENGVVLFSEFAQIIAQLNYGKGNTMEEKYQHYPDDLYTTYKDAADYLVAALGYEVYEQKYNGEDARILIGDDIGLYDGVKFEASKNITRGELAQMLYNALDTEMLVQSSFGSSVDYKKDPTSTIISKSFNAAFIRGAVTGQDGIRIGSHKSPENGTLEISGMPYYIGNNSVADLLGYTVFAVVEKDEKTENEYSILAIDVDEEDTTVKIDLDDVISLSGSRLTYEKDGKAQKISTGSIDSVTVCGDNTYTALTSDMLNREGEIIICADELGGSYNTAIISSYNTYKVLSVSGLSERINFAHKAFYNGNNYLDYIDKELYIRRNGIGASIEDIAVGDVISFVESIDKKHIKIIATDRSVTGTVTSKANGDVYIDDTMYIVSSVYNDFCTTDSANISELKVNNTGKFHLDYSGKIVSFTNEDDTFKWGLIVKIGKKDGIDSSVMVKLFNTSNEWETLELADSLTLDGEKGKSKADAYTAITAIQADPEDGGAIFYRPIRYKLNGNKEISFLDTAYDNVSYESNDKEAIRHKGDVLNQKINWTMDLSFFKNINEDYNINNNTKMFTVPNDHTREKEFAYDPSPKLTIGYTENLAMYNVDDFNMTSLMIRKTGGGANFIELYSPFIVERVYDGLDENGDECKIVRGFDGTADREWKIKEYVANENCWIFKSGDNPYGFTQIDDANASNRQLNPGDIIQIAANGTELMNFGIIARADDYSDRFISVSDIYGNGPRIGLGIVLDIDAASNCIKYSNAGKTKVSYAASLAMYDTTDSRNRLKQISIGDVQAGDEILTVGGASYMRCLIIRK